MKKKVITLLLMSSIAFAKPTEVCVDSIIKTTAGIYQNIEVCIYINKTISTKSFLERQVKLFNAIALLSEKDISFDTTEAHSELVKSYYTWSLKSIKIK